MGAESRDHGSYDQDVGARSGAAVFGLVLVLPVAALLSFLAWKAFHAVIYGPEPPSYVGQPQTSTEFSIGLFVVFSLFAMFFGNIAAKLVAGLYTGHSVRALIPWWFAMGVLAFLVLSGSIGAAITAAQGNFRGAAKGFAAVGLCVGLLLGPARRLRERQRSA